MATEPDESDKGQWRDLTAYWILGLCNNFGYVVMLSAAHDIIGQFEEDKPANDEKHERLCHILSTGTVLLADIIPSMTIKLFAPFLPFWMNVRMFVAIACAALGFIWVALATVEWMALMGIILTSLSCGLGETSLLSHSASYNKNVISTWSSGTGGAGIVGSLAYAGLTQLNISPRNTMLIMLLSPTMEAVAFWVLMRRPDKVPPSSLETGEFIGEDIVLIDFKEKLHYILELQAYMLPLVFVYFFEYFINQGLFELVNFEDAFIDHPAQYRWLNVVYQIGVFVSRSSVNIVNFKRIWIMAVLQGINVIYFLIEVLYFITPSIWIVFIIVFWEGLLGGAGYVNTFYRMSKEIPPGRRRFAMAIVAQSDSFGITAAGFLAMPVHNKICESPAVKRAL